MQDIELRIPVELTASRIQGHAQISAAAARQMAIELHEIVTAVQTTIRRASFLRLFCRQ